MSSVISYNDADDQSYGLAGMAISLVVYDGEEVLSALSLNENDEDGILFSPTFYFAGNPRYSAKLAWHHILNNYQLWNAMMLGNVMCRNYVRAHKQLSMAMIDLLKDHARAQGKKACELEQDEIDEMFNQTVKALHRVFSHTGVQQLATNLADTLRQKRYLLSSEVFEILSPMTRY